MGSSSEEEKPAKVVRTIPQFSSFKSAPAPSTGATVVPAAPVAQKPPTEEKKSEPSDDRKRRKHDEDGDHRRGHHHHSEKHRSRDRRRDDTHEDGRRRKEQDRDRHRDDHRRDRDRDRDKDRSRDRHRHKDRDRSRDRDDDSRRRRHHHSRRSRSKSRSKSRSRDRHRSHRKSPPPKIAEDPKGKIVPWETKEVQYIVDVRGDPHNITYGTIHRYSIPSYNRIGYGRVLGLSRRLRIDKDKGDGKGLVVSERVKAFSDSKQLSGQGSHIFAMEKSKPLRVKNRIGEDEEEPFVKGHGFVAFSSSSKRKRVTAEDDQTWKSNVEYRSIHGMEKSKDKEVSDSDLEEASSGSEHEIEVFDAATREKTIRLSRLVDSEPNNIDAWFDFVEHQEAMMLGAGGEGRRRKVRQGEKQGLEEVKASIFEKALAKNKGNSRLLVAYMETGAGIWDPPKLKLKWQEILKENPSQIVLWMRYINFRVTDFGSFRYRDCIQEFEHCLEMLRKAVHVYGLSDSAKEKLEEVILYMFLRLTIFVGEAGFSELGGASWQCMMELNTARPRAFSAPETHQQHVALLKSLEGFWDSEVLRIGEAGAKGWDAYASEDVGDFPDPKDQESTEGLNTNVNDPYLFEAWADKESELSDRLAARTTDEVEEDDPFQVILFSDIRTHMYCFQTDTVKRMLRYAFLNFYGIMVPRSFSLDSFVRSDVARMKHEYLDAWFWPTQDEGKEVKLISWTDGEAMEPERKSGLSRSPFSFKSPHIPLTPDAVCANPSRWFSALAESDSLKLDLDFVARVIRELSFRLEDDTLAIIFLSIESYRDPKAVKKAARALLKKFSTSLPLYNAYAQLEWRARNIDAARNVFAAALAMSGDMTDEHRTNPILLWYTWVWEEIATKDYSRALGILTSIPDGAYQGDAEGESSSSGATLLRARRFLDETRYYLLTQKEYDNAIMYTACLALLEYLSPQVKELEAPLMLFEKLEDDFKLRQLEGSEAHENLLLAKSRLIYFHMTTSKHFKAQVLRDVLEGAISIFPDNTAFLSLYLWNEGRTRIENRVRTVIQDKVLKEGRETSNAFVFAIWVELHMDLSRVNASAVRNLFEKAVENERTRSSIALWTLYIRFETRQRDPKRSKDVLFRAIRACPWSKDIMMLAFTKLASALGFEEMRKVHAVMVEKELRVHLNIEDTLEEWDEKYGRRSGGGGGIGNNNLEANMVAKPLPEDSLSEEEVDED